MENETKSLSKLVKEQFPEYDYRILKSYAVLTDAFVPNGGGPPPPGDDLTCFWCEVAVGVGTILLCIAVIWWFPPAVAFCIEALDIFLITGSTYITCQLMGFCTLYICK